MTTLSWPADVFYDETRDMLKRAYAEKTSPKPIYTIFVR